MSTSIARPNPSTRLLLMRHGTTDANTSGLFLGHTDVPLSDVGRTEVAALGQRLRGMELSTLWTSDLIRAHDTARAIVEAHATELPLAVDQRLREMHLGDFEGVPAKEVHANHPDLIERWVHDPQDVRMPGDEAETLAEVQERAWEAILSLVETHDGKTIGIVSHTFTLLVLLCRFMDLPISQFRKMHIDRASISEINWNRYGATLRRFNDTGHLAPR